MPRPDSDEINLRLQAYQLSVQAGSTPDTVYQWLTAEALRPPEPELSVVADITDAPSHSCNVGKMSDPYVPSEEDDPDERRRSQFRPAGKGRPEQDPETNYFLPENAQALAAAFLSVWYFTKDAGLRTRENISPDAWKALISAAGQSAVVYGVE